MKHTFTLIFALLLTISSFAQTKSITNFPPLTKATPSSVGMSSERLERIDRMLEEAIQNNEIPGAVALVARNGKIVYHKAFGTAEHKSGRMFQPNDIFRIASQTKAITATAVMMLWEEGKFSLDDPISKYIPEFADAQILKTFSEKDSSFTTEAAEKQITIRHLLSHTSGIGYGVIDGDHRIRKIYEKAGIIDLFTTENISIGDNIKRLAKLPLHHNPGERFTYSESLDVLGYFIEVMSGMPLDQFFKEKIFDPLGMKDTYFYLPSSKAARLVPIQTKKEEQWMNYPSPYFYDTDYPIKGAKAFFSGGAGLSSTAEDYATFLQMYLNNGALNGVRILSRTTIRTIMSHHTEDIWGDEGVYFGLAFSVLNQKGEDRGGRGSLGTFNWGGYFNTQYFADPEEKIIGILMKQTQAISGDNTARKFSQLVGQAIDD